MFWQQCIRHNVLTTLYQAQCSDNTVSGTMFWQQCISHNVLTTMYQAQCSDKTITHNVPIECNGLPFFWNYESCFNTYGGAGLYQGLYHGLYLYRTSSRRTTATLWKPAVRVRAKTDRSTDCGSNKRPTHQSRHTPSHSARPVMESGATRSLELFYLTSFFLHKRCCPQMVT